LKNSQLTCGERHAYFGDRTLGEDRSVLVVFYHFKLVINV